MLSLATMNTFFAGGQDALVQFAEGPPCHLHRRHLRRPIHYFRTIYRPLGVKSGGGGCGKWALWSANSAQPPQWTLKQPSRYPITGEMKGGMGGSGTQECVYQNWPDQIFPMVNFVFSRDGPFGLEGGGSRGAPPPPLRRWRKAVVILPRPSPPLREADVVARFQP